MIFFDELEPPPGSPRWRPKLQDGTKPTRWASTDPLGFSSDTVALDYDEWKGKDGAQRRVIAYGLTNCVLVFVS
ncbi:uncharacterized protein N7500_005618 [Penicillium coprophilum]|uniref:uncharacterized protein n=1 Tax=Penicillium coprophilum TaxID=36646 RepID=UPI0023A6CC92|nr:uncharacterized protein N7500_005618 [Penicillium coprophilum]KAJ5163788.1 hypothetical protein N7500_005618 [Penicillium coprophilum]